jgi:hypothetical protein
MTTLQEVTLQNPAVAKAQERAAKATAEANDRQAQAEVAAGHIIRQLQARSALVREERELERFANVDEPAIAEEATGELVSYLVGGCLGGKGRFEKAAVEHACRAFLRPHLPRHLEDLRARIKAIDDDVQVTAKAHGFDVPRIVAYVAKSIGRPTSELVPEQ